MAKMGRPLKADNEKLKNAYKIRVTDQEKEFISKYQEKHNIKSVSEVFRQGIQKLKESEN